jgi:IgGFc binding protein
VVKLMGSRGNWLGARKRVGAVAAAALVGALMAVAGPASPASAGGGSGAVTTAGTDFWVTFPPNINTTGPTFNLFVSGPAAATGVLTDTDGTTHPFTVSAGAVTTLTVSTSVPEETVDGVVAEGVHVTATAPVTIYGLNILGGTSDAFTALPTNALGTRYRIASYTPAAGSSRLSVVGTTDGTTVTVTPSVTVGARTAGTPFDVTVNHGQVYTLGGTTDITGTLVTADHPVAVYGSADCADVNVGGNNGACDVLIQQMAPTTSWGTDFAAVRFLKAAHGDPFRVVADADGTVVTVDGTVVATIDAGQFFDGVYGVPPVSPVNLNVGVHITTSHPAMVIQYQTGGTYTQGTTTTSGDPSMMLVPPSQQYLASYTIATPPTQFTVNDANVTVPTAVTASLRLDNAAVDPSEFQAIAGTTFSSAQLPLTLGSHTLTASLPFGVFVYGANSANSYAYPGGYAAASIAGIASISPSSTSVEAAAGAQVCVAVTVRDTAHAVVPGVRVDGTVSGANPTSVFAVSDGSGVANVCYAATNAGTDMLQLSAGAVTATVTVTVTGGTVGSGSVPTGGGAAATPTGAGYWSLTSGMLSAHGNAADLGSENGARLNAPIVAINSSTTGHGYWLAAAEGGVFTFGDAGFYGSMGAKPLNQNIVGIARTPDNHGYWIVSSDGGVFSFGDAHFYGSLGARHLNQPIVGVASTPDGHGYWLIAADGGVFSFGDAHFYGSMGGTNLNRHLTGIAATPDGHGYWLIAADGGVFTFGNANFFGSLGGSGATSISGIVANANLGYRLIGANGVAHSFGVTP